MSVNLIDGHIDDDEVDTSKRIPKKVLSEPWWNGLAYFCPTCKEGVRVKDTACCSECGQVLDWSDTERSNKNA